MSLYEYIATGRFLNSEEATNGCHANATARQRDRAETQTAAEHERSRQKAEPEQATQGQIAHSAQGRAWLALPRLQFRLIFQTRHQVGFLIT